MNEKNRHIDIAHWAIDHFLKYMYVFHNIHKDIHYFRITVSKTFGKLMNW